eukprot:TRINITY_DN23786_c0_g1_i1.p1 TRINITY_DN23786_c0_g1~~TRINITY_DN23786_c0_g1_i1.p1  ORF type:complete len:247 (+),score=51.87 TRINITY_DN23786_c0_g1_i1:40-741(+)
MEPRPAVNFGLPPDKDKPQPRFPGVSPTAFDPSGALQVYTDILKAEKNGRESNLHLQDNLARAHERVRRIKSDPIAAAKQKLGDSLPGHSSLGSFYAHVGYERNYFSGSYVPAPKEAADKGKVRRKQQKASEDCAKAPPPVLSPQEPSSFPKSESLPLLRSASNGASLDERGLQAEPSSSPAPVERRDKREKLLKILDHAKTGYRSPRSTSYQPQAAWLFGRQGIQTFGKKVV